MPMAFIDAFVLSERLNRQFHAIIKAHLDERGIRDISPIQALTLLRIGDDAPSLGEISRRGYYVGTNASYNIRDLVRGGYLSERECDEDRRRTILRATPKGRRLQADLAEACQRATAALAGGGILTAARESMAGLLAGLTASGAAATVASLTACRPPG